MPSLESQLPDRRRPCNVNADVLCLCDDVSQCREPKLPASGERGTCEHDVGLAMTCRDCPEYGRTLPTGHLVRCRQSPLPERRKGGQLPMRFDVAGELIERVIEWHRSPGKAAAAARLHRATARYLEVIGE